jgi:exopolyphosphatase / guanosine-5'-triphosphate,3'-diphosphate pyrophosphatase
LKIRKYAAIDIGSNAIRLLIHNVIEQENRETQFRKSSLIRVPVRLGEDAFTRGEISVYNIERVIQTMKGFKHLMAVMKVERYRACATSAMREARNSGDIIKKIRRKSGVDVRMIDGQEEAAIIASTDLGQFIQKGRWYLYIDVGGGSTEFSLIRNGAIEEARSFKIGTVRIINNMADELIWDEIETWIGEKCRHIPDISIIGSGGNINKLHRMSGRREGEPLSYFWLHSQYQKLRRMSFEDRILELGLNPDRADVILPATRIFLHAAKWSGAKKIQVPQIGLSDGIIKTLYREDQHTRE